MKLTLKKDYRCLKPGTLIINPSVNYWVGSNGTGKSSMVQLLLGHLYVNKKLGNKNDWNSRYDNSDLDALIKAEGDSFDELIQFSDKQRQSHFIDLDSTMSYGIEALWMSEGQNAYNVLARAKQHINNSKALLIFDELDSHLDYAGKWVYFNRLLPAIRGTAIVISHDPLFLHGCRVLDFGDMQMKNGEEYYQTERDRLSGGGQKKSKK
jgi:ABC-type transport system involved in cytochrome bd biosynthesis fused ATPase/permease subunit